MKIWTERRFVLIEDSHTPPYILGEVAGVELVREPPVVIDGEVVPYSTIDFDAEQFSDGQGRIVSRGELEAGDPVLRRALDRWEAGDDTPLAESTRLFLIETALDGVEFQTKPEADAVRRSVQDAIAHGPILIPA